MSSKGTVEAVEQQLAEAGEKLLQLPSSLDELISVLDLAENSLGKVEQSPGKSMHDALSSLRMALVSDELLGHPDTDVKVSVASCISEITRITAPDAPYDDEKMKRVFQLIVSSFENLSDKSSRSYNKRAVILETVAKVRSCVIMLDLECDDLIMEMFQIFFRTIRDYHPDSIFTSMETIMNLVLEESEDISTELLTTLLSSVKRDNEEVPPIARRLGERILRTSAVKLKPYLIQAVKHSDISLDNYSNILNSVCEGTVGEDASNNALVQKKPSDECKAAAASIKVTQEGDACKAAVATSEATQEGHDSKAATATLEEIQVDDGNKATVASSEVAQVGDGSKDAAASSEETQEDAKDVERYCLVDKPPTAKRSSKALGSNGSNVTSKEKASVKGELSQKGETSETENKSTNDEEIPKSRSHALGVEKSTASESKSKSKKTSKNRRKKASSSKKSESSEPSHVDSEKEAKLLPNNVDCHEKGTNSLLAEDIPPVVKNVESDKETCDIKAREDVNSDSPSPSAGEADESLPKRDGHQQEKECASQGEVSSPERVTEKEAERASDSLEAFDESPAKETPQESPLKDESSVEVGTSKPEDSGSSDSEDKPVKDSTKKLDLTDSDDDDLLLKKKQDSIRRARTKANRPGKGASKSSTKDDVKEVVSSQNRTAKSAKAQENEGELLSKRKRSLGKEASGQLKYGKNLIRSKVKVWWPMDQQFYEGVIVSYEPDKRKHQVVYDDGEVELLNLRKEKWKLVGDSVTDDDEPASTDASSEMPKSKKVKKSATSFVKQQDLDDISPKRLSASSSKSKGISSKSGKRAKNGKAESKSKDVTSKSGAISEDESGSKSKAHSQSGSKTKTHTHKLSGKSVNDAPKSSGKAKDIDNSTPKSKSKEDTPKAGGKSKDDTPKTAGRSKEDTAKTSVKGKTLGGSGSKSSVNGASKVKFSLSKGKDSHVKEKPSESPEVPESTKRKLSDSSKDQGSEAKSEKKRRRSVKG